MRAKTASLNGNAVQDLATLGIFPAEAIRNAKKRLLLGEMDGVARRNPTRGRARPQVGTSGEAVPTLGPELDEPEAARQGSVVGISAAPSVGDTGTAGPMAVAGSTFGTLESGLDDLSTLVHMGSSSTTVV